MQYKTCTKCGNELPATAEYFHRDKNRKDGLYPQCKECQSINSAKHYANKKDYYQELRAEYRKNNKEKESERHKKYYQENKDKLLAKGKEYQKKYYKPYYENNKQKKYYSNKAWREVNKDKITGYEQKRVALKNQLPATLTTKQWVESKEYFNHQCAYCGKTLKNLTQDHFIALNNGGEYTHNNIVPACLSCNCSKQDKDFFEWYPQQEFYSKEREQKILDFLGYQQGIQQLTIAL